MKDGIYHSKEAFNDMDTKEDTMKTSNKIWAILTVAIFMFCCGIATTDSQVLAAEKTHKWVGQAFCSQANRLFENGQDFAYMIEKYTDGKVKIDFHAAGELCPAMQVLQATSEGLIDFGQACPCVARSKAYALQFFCDAPGAQSPVEQIIWYYYGGGKKIFEDLFHKHYKAHPLPMVAITAEVWIYSNKKINTLDDLKGLKMRAAGVRADVMKHLGASVVVMGGGEIVPAMERGVIDAMEYSSINCTYPLGFCDVAKYLYMHPTKSTSAINMWIVSLDKWNALTPELQKAVEKASRDMYLMSLGWSIVEDTVTLKKACEEKKATMLTMPKEVARQFDEASADYYYEKAKTDPEVKLILDSWAKFKKDYGPYAKWIDFFNMTGDHLGLVKGDS